MEDTLYVGLSCERFRAARQQKTKNLLLVRPQAVLCMSGVLDLEEKELAWVGGRGALKTTMSKVMVLPNTASLSDHD